MSHSLWQFFTPTRLYYDGPEPLAPGEFMRSSGGAVYLIRRARRSPTIRLRKYLDVLRFDPAQVPLDAVVHEFYWYPRGRSRTGHRRTSERTA